MARVDERAGFTLLQSEHFAIALIARWGRAMTGRVCVNLYEKAPAFAFHVAPLRPSLLCRTSLPPLAPCKGLRQNKSFI
jgi:hypothetical protein